MKTLADIQQEVGRWAKAQFGPNFSKDPVSPLRGQPLGSLLALLGMGEELGELYRCTARRHQGRGYSDLDEYQGAQEDAVADLLVFLCDYSNREGIDLTTVLNRVWAADKAAEAVAQDTEGDLVKQDTRTRTKKEVLEARRQATIGCCSDFADMMSCNCMEEATGTTGCSVCSNPNCDHPNEKH